MMTVVLSYEFESCLLCYWAEFKHWGPRQSLLLITLFPALAFINFLSEQIVLINHQQDLALTKHKEVPLLNAITLLA